MDEAEARDRWLGKALWPWPLALAYSATSDKRDDAISVAVYNLENYPKVGTAAEYAGLGAAERVFQALGGPSKEVDDDGNETGKFACLEALEAPLLRLLSDGKIQAWGRADANAQLNRIEPSSWVGAEIISGKTCDLGRAGWRAIANSLDSMLDNIQPTIWFRDIHLERDHMIARLSPSERMPSLVQAPPQLLGKAETDAAFAARVQAAVKAGQYFTLEDDEIFLRSCGMKHGVRNRAKELRGKFRDAVRPAHRPPGQRKSQQ